MILAIMQPYLFPYIGYWQLINTVDTFVIYDDVNFIKQGYINKNNILSNGKKQVFTLELIGASSNKLINEIKVGNNSKKLIKSINQNYIKAPYYEKISPIIKDVLNQDENNLAKFVGYSLQKISNYLEIDTKILYSSNLEKDNNLRAQNKVLSICKELNASKYVNTIGGQELYSKDDFQMQNIKLNFLDTKLVKYKQFKNEFIPYLSIIDILMFNSKEEAKDMLNKYELV